MYRKMEKIDSRNSWHVNHACLLENRGYELRSCHKFQSHNTKAFFTLLKSVSWSFAAGSSCNQKHEQNENYHCPNTSKSCQPMWFQINRAYYFCRVWRTYYTDSSDIGLRSCHSFSFRASILSHTSWTVSQLETTMQPTKVVFFFEIFSEFQKKKKKKTYVLRQTIQYFFHWITTNPIYLSKASSSTKSIS